VEKRIWQWKRESESEFSCGIDKSIKCIGTRLRWDYLWHKRNLDSSNWARINMLGELDPAFYFTSLMVWIVYWIGCIYIAYFMYSSCFWNFPETAEQMMNHRQVTHPNYMKFWVPAEEPPGGTSLTARRRKRRNPVLGFPMNGLAVEIHPPVDANQFWFNFDVLDVLGWL